MNFIVIHVDAFASFILPLIATVGYLLQWNFFYQYGKVPYMYVSMENLFAGKKTSNYHERH